MILYTHKHLYVCVYVYNMPFKNNPYNNATLIHFHSMYFPEWKGMGRSCSQSAGNCIQLGI